MKKKWTALLLIMVLLVSVSAGCAKTEEKEEAVAADSTETQESAPAAELPEKVVIGTQEMPNDEGIAKALDYFTQEMGVPVELVKFDSGRDVNTAIASGSIDFGLLGSCPASLAISQDLGVEFIWIHEVLGSVESLVARADAGINSLSDLKGKTVATPFASTAHFSLLKAIESAGLDQSDVKILDMQTSEIFASWENDEIDAAYIWEPTLSQLGDAKTVTTSGDMAELGFMTSNVEIVRKEFADQYPELVAAYIRALNKSVKMYQEDNETAVSTIADVMELSTEDAKFQMSGSSWLNAAEQLSAEYMGTSDAKGAIVQNLYDTAVFLKDQGSIKEVPELSVFEEAVNPKYIEMATEN